MFLLGKPAQTQNEAVKKIAEAFNSSFKVFKEDKEVVNVLSLAERYTSEGKIEGKLEGADKMFELIKSGLSPEEALCKVKEGKD